MDGVRVSVEELSPTVLIVRGRPGEGLEYDWACVAIVDGTNVKALAAKYIAAAFGEVTRLGLRTIQYERLVNGAAGSVFLLIGSFILLLFGLLSGRVSIKELFSIFF